MIEKAVTKWVNRASEPHGPIGQWDVSHMQDMTDLFARVTLFNGDLSEWDVSSVTKMPGMFTVTAFLFLFLFLFFCLFYLYFGGRRG